MKLKTFKKIFAILFSISCLMNFQTVDVAAESQPEFAITDEFVIINSVSYKIHNNTIQYNGETYEVEENYTLSKYDENGRKIICILPVEQNRVTDPVEIAQLNAAVAELEENSTSAYSFPSSHVSLPYSANVPKGQYMTITPAFKMIESQFSYKTKLKLTNFPLLADRRFHIIFSTCDPTGNWTSVTIPMHDFLVDNVIAYQNLSSMRYGRFSITNLYGDPSPSYTYKIYLSNL